MLFLIILYTNLTMDENFGNPAEWEYEKNQLVELRKDLPPKLLKEIKKDGLLKPGVYYAVFFVDVENDMVLVGPANTDPDLIQSFDPEKENNHAAYDDVFGVDPIILQRVRS